MTTESDALLAGIFAAPDDDAPRLVYADWLDEHGGADTCLACNGNGREGPSLKDLPPIRERIGADGRVERYIERPKPLYTLPPECEACRGAGRISNGNAERAEFIRVQCELVRTRRPPTAAELFSGKLLGMPPCTGQDKQELMYPSHPDSCGKCPGCLEWSALAEGYNALRAREWELRWAGVQPIREGLDCGAVQWLGFDDKWLAGWKWARGFVDTVTCTAADWLAHADAILAVHPVQEVQGTGNRQSWRFWMSGDRAVSAAFYRPPLTSWVVLDEVGRRLSLLADAAARPIRPTEDETDAAYLSARWPSVKTWHLPAEPRGRSGALTIGDHTVAVTDWAIAAADAYRPVGEAAARAARAVAAAAESLTDAAESKSAAPPDNARRRPGHSRMPGWLADRRARPGRR